MSKIALPVAELKPALIGLGKVLNRRSTLPVLSHLKVERTQEGWIALTANDLDTAVTVRLEQPVDGDPCSFLVPYEELYKTAKACGKQDTITLEEAEKSPTSVSVIIHYPTGQQSAQTKVDSVPVEEFPTIPRILGEPIPLPDSLRTSIHEAIECSSEDETRLILNSAFIDVTEPKCHHVVGTNGRILYSSNSFSLPLAKSIVIPSHPFLAWKEFNSDGEWQLRLDPKDTDTDPPPFQITSRRWRFISKQIDGQYPNWRQVVPALNSFEIRLELAADSLESIIQTIQRMPCHDSLNHTIGLEWSSRKFFLLGKSTGADQLTKVEIPLAKGRGKDATIFLNRQFLSTGLKFGLNLVEITDGMAPLRLSNSGRQMIIMPVRPPDCGSKVEEVAYGPVPVPEPPQQPAETESKPAQPAAAIAPAAPPPKERSTMNNTTTTNGTAATNGATTPPAVATTDEQAPASDLDQVLEFIDDLRESLSTNLTDLRTMSGKLKQIKRDQKTTEREMQTFRQTLRGLQSVRL